MMDAISSGTGDDRGAGKALEVGGGDDATEDRSFSAATSLPENCLDYMIFLIDSEMEGRRLLSGLQSVRKAAMQLADTLTKDYIWQRDGFGLEVKSHSGLLYLHGITDHGDALEDEWLIVYMLRELSRSFQNIWVRVSDSDGEFLLVEAANVAPKWLNPEMDANRVWIHDGKLLLLPVTEGIQQGRTGSRSVISLPEAVSFIRANPEALIHSSFVEAEAFYRLEKYPGQIADSIHYSLVTIPRKLVYVLHELPKSIAPAVEAFYLRDPVSLKPIMSATAPRLEFPPVDLVTVSVRFTKVLFAQLRSQRFSTPPMWANVLGPADETDSSAAQAHSARARREMGMKLAVGFELLAAKAEQSRSRVSREVDILLEDLREDGLSGLPTDAEMRTWRDVDRDDDEAWLDINYDDFDRELQGRKRGDEGPTTAGFGSSSAQADLRKIVSRFEAFLNDDEAGLDGAEVDEMDVDDDESDTSIEDSEDEDKAVSFDEEEFSRMMREMMGIPARDPRGKATGPAPTRRRNDEEIEADDSEEIKELAAQMEAELKEHGALKLDPKPREPAALEGKGVDRAGSPSTARTGGAAAIGGEADTDSDDDEEDGEVDINYNLAKNLLVSFKSQAGMAGPAGNIMGMMGLSLPRDEDEEEDPLTSK